MKHAREHLIQKINDAELQTHPYPYLYIQEVFPLEFYRELIANIPSIKNPAFKKLSEQYQSRYVLDLFKGENGNESIKTFSSLSNTSFWKEFQDAFIKNSDVVNAFKEKYNGYIRNANKTYINARITKDLLGYFIGPHRDKTNKLFSVVFYLTEKEDNNIGNDWGTGLYVPKGDDFVHTDKHYSFDEFELYKIAEARPNSLFSWAVTYNSYHGVTPTTIEGERVTLGYFLKEV